MVAPKKATPAKAQAGGGGGGGGKGKSLTPAPPVARSGTKAAASAKAQPAAKELFSKQYYNIVPAKSLDDAKAWLASEIALWRKTTSEIKIETAE